MHIHRKPFNTVKMTDSPGSISIPFIYIKPKSSVPEPPQKIRYTSTLKQLLGKCQNKFKTVKTVRSLFSETGFVVRTIEDITPGATYLVSSKPPSDEDYDEERPTKQKEIQLSTPVHSSEAFTKLFGGSNESQPEPQANVLKLDDEEEDHEGIANNEEEEIADNDNLPTKPQKDLSKLSSAQYVEEEDNISEDDMLNQYEEDENEILEEEEFNQNAEEESSVEKEGEPLDSENEQYHANHEDELEKDNENKDHSEEENESEEGCGSRIHSINQDDDQKNIIEEEETNENDSKSHLTLQDIVNELVPGADIVDLLPNAIVNTKRNLREFAKAAPELEKQQFIYWSLSGINYLANEASFPQPSDDFIGIDELNSFAKKFVEDHRIISGNGSILQFHSAIVGPSHSGRSTLLSLISKHIMIETAVTGSIKKNFLFILNSRLLTSSISDCALFYKLMIDLVFKNLSWQLPQLKPYSSQFVKFLQNVIDFKSPPHISQSSIIYQVFPTFSKNLDLIASQYSSAYHGSYSDWMRLILDMPAIISRAAGYRSVLYIIDDFDSIDIQLQPVPPFSTDETDYIHASELLKSIIEKESYIICSSDQRQLLDILRPSDEYGIDLRSRTDITSTLGIVTFECDEEIVVNLKDEPLPIKINVSQCGGVAPYIKKWVEIKDFLQKVEDDDENLINAIALLQEFMNELFVTDQKPLTVVGAKISGK